MPDRHIAPRKRVVRVSRTGKWGNFVWTHALECGHVEKRKRKSSRSHIGCAACVEEQRLLIKVFELEEQLSAVPVDQTLQTEGIALRSAARIASLLSIPVEFVDVKMTDSPAGLVISGASVWVPKEILENLGSG